MTKLTPQELDRKIHILACAAVGADDEDHADDEFAKPVEDAIKQLIRDCIEAVTPERYISPFEGESIAQDIQNNTIDALEDNTKELLG